MGWGEDNMKELEHRLNNLPNTYFAFVHAITTYANKKRERYEAIMKFLDENPDTNPSDVTKFVAMQPDFFEDDVRNVDGVNQRIYN